MSVTAGTSKVQYVLTSATQALFIPFFFVEANHVKVVRTRDGVDTVLGTGFAVAGAGNTAGGNLTLAGTHTQIGDRITIKRSIPLTQLFSYAPNDRFPASTQERALDLLTMLAQQVSETAGRALVFGEGELADDGNVLPNEATRADKAIGFDEDGDLDLTVSLQEIRRLILVNPVGGLLNVTDYGTLGETTDVADWGTI